MSPKRYKISSTGQDHDRHQAITIRPDTPPLSRGSSPPSSISPTTPTLRLLSPMNAKMRQRHVAFASPVAAACRRASWDELAVMRAFASHATHCPSCANPTKTYSRGGALCDRGAGLAKDLGTYLYCLDGKPHSIVDKRSGREEVQVEVPPPYAAVLRLFQALNSGLNLRKRGPSHPDVYQSYEPRTPYRSPPSKRHTMDPPSSYGRSPYRDEAYEIRPARTDSRRSRDTVYPQHGNRYKTRTPYDDLYTSKSPGYSYSHSPYTKDRYNESKMKADTYYDHKRSPYETVYRPRECRRDRYHIVEEPRKKRYSNYFVPSVSHFWR